MIKKSLFSLRIGILAVYVVTFVSLISTIIILESIILYKAMSSVAHTMMKDASTSVLKQLSLQIEPAEASIKLTKSLLENNLINDKQMENYTLYVAENLPSPHLNKAARIVAWGDTKGDSIETSLDKDGTYFTAIINLQTNSIQHVRKYRDSSDHVIKSVNISTNYDPRIRPWYIAAEHAKKINWSDVFLSYPYRNLSTAVSVPIYKKGVLQGVFEIEVKLVAISNFLSTLDVRKDGVAFIVNAKNELVAFPGMQKIMSEQGHAQKLAALEASGKPWLPQAFALFNQNHVNQFKYEYDGEVYLASFEDIPEFSSYGWQIGIVIPQKSFLGPLEKANTLITLISLVILLIGVLFASLISRRISEPLGLLVNDTEKIKHFHLEGEQTVRSIIKEVDYLGVAIHSMKVNLRSFQKYLPANLVRQLIQTGEDIQLGGTKKILTIFFSDIQNFTTISETMDAEQLMLYLCEYLDELSKIILEENGTIDKYIGDSVMAFWGAPLSDEEHCLHGCRAALRCRKRLDELYVTWQKQGKSPFITRIGIHTGEALVGNIGSSERLNYTALGDSINVASRLEGMNKIYDTRIIVSEEVVKILDGKFVFRLLDRMAVRGRINSYKIYELMDENLANIPFDFNQYRDYFEKGFAAYQQQHWNEAINYFKHCLMVYPADKQAVIFIQRCEFLQQNTPPPDWDGVWRN